MNPERAEVTVAHRPGWRGGRAGVRRRLTGFAAGTYNSRSGSTSLLPSLPAGRKGDGVRRGMGNPDWKDA